MGIPTGHEKTFVNLWELIAHVEISGIPVPYLVASESSRDKGLDESDFLVGKLTGDNAP